MTDSIFKKYLEACRNSFDSIILDFDHTRPLYAFPILIEGQYHYVESKCTFLKSKNGFFLKNDNIIVNDTPSPHSNDQLSIKINLSKWNRFIYSFREIRDGIGYLFYTQRGFSALQKYVCALNNELNQCFVDEIVGAITIYTFSSSRVECTASATFLISKTPNITFVAPIQTDSIPIEENLKYSPKANSSYLKAINIALYEELYHRLKEGVFNRRITDQNGEIWNIINDSRNDLSDEVIDICAFLFPQLYSYSKNSKIYCQYRDDIVIAFNKLMINWYRRGIADMDIPVLFYEEEIKEYELLFDKVLKDVILNKNKISWLDNSDVLSMEYISALYIVQTLIKPDRIQQKAVLAVWLYYMLYRKILSCGQQEQQMYKILIFHLIGCNHRTFEKLFDKIKGYMVIDPKSQYCKTPHTWKDRNSSICVAEIVCYFSNTFNPDYSTLSIEQRKYVGERFICAAESSEEKNRLQYFNQYEQLLTTSVTHTFLGITDMCKGYALHLFNYISELLHNPNYTNKDILDIVAL